VSTNELKFDPVIESNDGADGEVVFETAVPVSRLMQLVDDGNLVVGNIRPDHKVITTKRGERFKRRSDRQKNWTQQLSHGKGVLGNLSWNIDPDHHEIAWDEDAGELSVKGANGAPVKIKTPDSATRHRSIMDAWNAPLRTINPDRRVSVRIWMVPENPNPTAPDDLSEPLVFDAYNQDGKPVNETVARLNYQRDDLERLVKEFVLGNSNLGLDNVENIQNSVARESKKVAAYNTFVTAFKDGYTSDVSTPSGYADELRWINEYWNQLVTAVPEVGVLSLAQRKAARQDSVVASAVLIHAYVRLADYMRTNGIHVSTLSKLSGLKVTLQDDSKRTKIDPVSGQIVPLRTKGEVVDFFSFDNPIWVNTGVVMTKVSKKDGTTTAETRNAYQSRVAAFDVLKGALGI